MNTPFNPEGKSIYDASRTNYGGNTVYGGGQTAYGGG